MADEDRYGACAEQVQAGTSDGVAGLSGHIPNELANTTEMSAREQSSSGVRSCVGGGVRISLAALAVGALFGLFAPGAPAARSRLDVLATAHVGGMSVMTTNPPPGLKRVMHWSKWSPARRQVQGIRSFGSRAVVGVDPSATLASVAASYRIGTYVPIADLHAFEALVSDESLRALLGRGTRDRRIRYVEPMEQLRYDHPRSDYWLQMINATLQMPYEWQFGSAHVDLAYNLALGDSSIVVGIVDSGLTPITDLSGQIADRWYYVSQTSTADDFLGHGTAVASLIASRPDTYGLAGFGGFSRVTMFKDTQLSQVTVAVAIDKLVSLGVRVINLSIGGPSMSFLLADSIARGMNAGVLFVASSGNDGAYTVSYPAAFLQPANGVASYGLAVGASNYLSGVAAFSNKGYNLSLVAPGDGADGVCDGVLTALPPIATEIDGTCYPRLNGPDGNRYAYLAGTSFSAPEVAGVAALIWSVRPDLKNYEVANILKQSAYRAPGTGWGPVGGWGVLNAAAALEQATGRTAADRITVGQVIFPNGVPAAGGQLIGTATVAWGDGAMVNNATVGCDASVDGAGLPLAFSKLDGGVATCAWTTPTRAGGKTVTTQIRIQEPTTGISAVGQPSQATLADATPPIADARGASGHWGKAVQLTFVASDETGAVATSIVVTRNAVSIGQFDTPLRQTTEGQMMYQTWIAPTKPRKGKAVPTYAYCVTARDATGNTSQQACRPIVLN